MFTTDNKYRIFEQRGEAVHRRDPRVIDKRSNTVRPLQDFSLNISERQFFTRKGASMNIEED